MRLVSVLSVCALSFSVGARAAEPPALPPIRADIVRQWVYLGATQTFMHDVPLTGPQPSVIDMRQLPAFSAGQFADFESLSVCFSPNSLRRLPTPDVPFGLDLSVVEASTADLREVARMTTLRSLRLGKRDSKALAPLRALPDLRSLEMTADEDDMDDVASLPRLRVLKITDRALTTPGLTKLRGKRLARLELPTHPLEASWLKAYAETVDAPIDFSFSYKPISDRDLAALATVLRIGSLALDHTRIGDAEVKHLGSLQHLERLSLERTRITGAATPTLARLTHLRDLNLRRTAVTSGSLAALTGLQDLETLDLSDTSITDDGLRHLGELAKLRVLILSKTRITGAGMRHLARLAELERLVLSGVSITDDGLEQLTGLKKLKGLFFDDRKVTDAGIRALRRIESLEEVALLSAKLSDEGVRILATMPHLRRLEIGVCATDDRTKFLYDAKRLRSLSLTHAPVTAKGLGTLQGLDLEHLFLPSSAETSQAVQHLVRLTRSSKQELDLGSWRIVGADLAALAGSKWKSIDVPAAARTDVGFRYYLAALNDVSSLSLSGWDITDVSWNMLLKLPVKSLSLRHSTITDARLDRLADLRGLRRIILDRSNVTDEGLEALRGLNLHELEIPEHAKTDLGLRNYLAAVEPPLHLSLRNWKITNNGVKALAKQQRLAWLHLNGQHIGDVAVKEIVKIQTLFKLDLSETLITDRGVALLADLPALERLDLEKTSVQALPSLGECQRLRSLNLARTKLTAAGVDEIAKLRGLRELRLEGTRLTDEDLHKLIRLTELEVLHLDETRVTDAGLRDLAELPRLRVLSLRRTSTTDIGLLRLMKSPELRQINLGSTWVTNAGLQLLLQFPKLVRAELNNTLTTNAAGRKVNIHYGY